MGRWGVAELSLDSVRLLRVPVDPAHRDIDLRIPEMVPVRERDTGKHTLAGEERVGDLTQRHLQGEARRRQERRTVQRAAERAREFGVGDRMRRRYVDRAAD